MKKKILVTIIAFVLSVLPFLIAIAISKYSPYVEKNSCQTYVILCSVISIVIVSVVLLLLKHFYQSFEKVPVGGILLFLLVCPLAAIFGLAAAPDVSLKMIEHPEREHLRYSLLFIALLLFGAFILFLYIGKSLKINTLSGLLMLVVFICAFAEFVWEFNHHYLYPEALREWISQGKNAEEFDKNYDSLNLLKVGVIGRYFQFISVAWLSLHFYKSQRVKIWCPIINILFSLLGIASATLVYTTHFPFPKGFEFLMLFFIPGIPFFLLYWLGVALLTRFRSSEIAFVRNQNFNLTGSANPV